jgi:oligosaccharide repeat unit polymerase
MFVFFACLFSLVALLVAFKGHDRFNPARYFLLMWGGQVVLIYGLFHNQFLFTGYGLVFIAMMILVFSGGSLLGQTVGQMGPVQERVAVDKVATFNSKRALLMLQGCLALGLAHVVTVVYAHGFSLRDLFSFETLLRMNVESANARYTTDATAGLLSQMLLIFVYVTPLYGGYLLPLLRGKQRIWCYLVFVPALLITLTQAVKLALITNVTLFIAGRLGSALGNNPAFLRIKALTMVKGVVLAVGFMGILFLSMLFRAGTFDAETVKYMTQNFMTYAFGHLPAFDAWFTQHLGTMEPTGGVKTFYGVSNLLGLAEREQGVFSDAVYFWKSGPYQIPSDMSTNVYTVFRFLMEDFGFVGSFLCMLLGGFVGGFAGIMVRRRSQTVLHQVVLVALFFFCFMSFATSVWVYTSYLATMVCFMGLLAVSFKRPSHVIFVNHALESEL